MNWTPVDSTKLAHLLSTSPLISALEENPPETESWIEMLRGLSKKERKRAYNVWYRWIHREAITAQCKEYRKKCREKDRKAWNEFKNKWQRKNRIRLNAKRRERRKNLTSGQRERINKTQQAWRKKNPQKDREYRVRYLVRTRIRNRHRRKTDPAYRLRINLRSRLRNAMRSIRLTKTDHILDLVDCSVFFLKSHLESKFKPGMSWTNYGSGDDKWHVDHIIPIARFDLSDLEQRKKCFHWTNLQPMWQPENHSKNSRYDGDYREKAA